MQLNPEATIAGFPILAVRDAVRHYLSWPFSADNFARRLHTPKQRAKRVIAELETMGYVETYEDGRRKGWKVTLAGTRFALATGAKPITRATAERKVAELLQRVAEVNANPRFLFHVVSVRVFGSYITDAKTLGDIDLLIKVARKPNVTDDQLLDHINNADRRFANITDQFAWPQIEVLLYLKNRSRAYSFHDPDDDRIASQAESRALYPKA